MSRIVDNLIAFKILRMLVTPFDHSDAFRLGIIDAKGKLLIKPSMFSTEAQRDAYDYLHRLVFNMKRLLAKLPGGDNRVKSMAAALFLIKEYYEGSSRSTALMEEKYGKLLETVNNNVILAEEEILVGKFFKEEGEGGAPANNTSGASVTEPKIEKKDIKKYQNMARRPKLVT